MSPSNRQGRRKVVLLGWPVTHSVSPAMHNAAFAALQMNWEYAALAVEPEGEAVARAVASLSDGHHAGANVTVPHKEGVIPHLHRLGEAAAAMGAVNTISVDDEGRLVGDNTDAAGFLDDLEANDIDPAGWEALILGAGGSARAVAYALASRGARRITVAARKPEQAEVLAEAITARSPAAVFRTSALTDALGQELEAAQLVVNCTPVGMEGSATGLPFPLEDLPFGGDHVFYDLVYNPRRTALIERASSRGARAFDGLGMLVRQGARSFRIWTGREAPLETMRRAAIDRMAAREQARQ